MTEKWVGEYFYDDSLSLPYRTSVPFTIEWTLNKGELTGICIDSNLKDYFETPATIDGYIDDNVISFMKAYPCYIESGPDGSIKL